MRYADGDTPRAGDHDIPLVVSQPDRPSGRGQQLSVPAVKQRALALGLPVVQPQAIKNNTELRAQLEQVRPQAIIVVAYGRIIPQWMIDLPPLGNLNAHASLLPKYRGAAPIQWAIANGETVTGVTTMRIDAGLDTGDMLLQAEIPIAEEDTAVTLSPKLAQLGAALMVETLQRLEAGKLSPTPQDNTLATLAPMLKKEDGRIDFSRTAHEIHNRLRSRIFVGIRLRSFPRVRLRRGRSWCRPAGSGCWRIACWSGLEVMRLSSC